jgi:hypothetical protein
MDHEELPAAQTHHCGARTREREAVPITDGARQAAF